MNTLTELTHQLSKEIQDKETRKRTRLDDEKIRFDYALTKILEDIWKNHFVHPDNECLINKNKNFYSENSRYRDPNLTYRMAMAAFDGLINLDMIYVTKGGYYDRTSFQGDLTRYKATERLLERIDQIEGHPAIYLKPDLDVEKIILRNEVDGKKVAVDYEETSFTDQARKNLRIINSCIARHWIDVRIKDQEFKQLQERLMLDEDKQPINHSNTQLYRIFTNNSFKEGGRFYRGWWQNVPSEYRKFITIDSKKTAEYDFTQLNPNMIYSLYNLGLGSDDAYSRVLDGEHRDIVKTAFNAMFQSSTQLTSKPKGIDLDKVGMTWMELRQAVLDSHKPIQHLFFKGLGNQLQFEDSEIAEGIMLHFSAMDAPALPIHDSFIMHHGYGGELEEAMRRSYYDIFKSDIGIKEEICSEIKVDKTTLNGNVEWDNIEFDHLMEKRQEYSKWNDRNDDWMIGSMS